MKTKITKEMKIALLKALKEGFIDFDLLLEMRIDAPARTLTREEVREYLQEIEREY